MINYKKLNNTILVVRNEKCKRGKNKWTLNLKNRR